MFNITSFTTILSALDFISSSVDKSIDELKDICHWKDQNLERRQEYV